MNYYWFKGFPGSYYLYDKPMGGARQQRGGCRKMDGTTYRAHFAKRPDVSIMIENSHTSAKRQMAFLEDLIRSVDPTATFTRENFK